MPVYKLNVKWQKERFSNVECDTDENAEKFKAVLFSLTGVPPERQKVMMPGKILGDDFDGIKLKDGSTVMLMGTTDALPKVQESNASIVSDAVVLSDDSVVLPFGLVNLGNTCYMNAAVQLLYSIPEARCTMKISPLPVSVPGFTTPHALACSLKTLFNSMETAEKEVIPAMFVSCLRGVFPQFATRLDGDSDKDTAPDSILSMIGGRFAQQDANECWLSLMNVLQNVIINPRFVKFMPPVFSLSGASDDSWNVVDRYFTGNMTTKLVCTELPASDKEDAVGTAVEAEEVYESEQTFTQLSCYINQDVKFLHTGLRNNFEGTLTKHSPSLGRDATFKKTAYVTRLPGYLCVHFVRFFYKEDKKLSAKVLKDVKFPLELDMFTFCSEDLKKQLVPMRDRMREAEDAETDKTEEPGKRSKRKREATTPNPDKNPELFEPYNLKGDPGSNNSGLYELQGVLSHQGRTSSAGHYVAWIKVNGTWMKFDDDVVTAVTPEDILRLSGGGDWHCAYLLLYAPKRLLKRQSEDPAATVKLEAATVDH